MTINSLAAPIEVGASCARRIVFRFLIVLLFFFVLTPSAFAQTGNLLTDPGFNSGSQALLPFTNTTSDRWLAEAAALVVGSENGISPDEGDGMLRIAEAGGTASQVRQVVDISAFATDIDAGNAFATYRANMNAPAAGARAGGNLAAFGAGTVGLGAPLLSNQSDVDFLDAVAGTWETRSVGNSFSFALPTLTRQLQAQVFYNSGTIPQNGYADSTFLEVTILPKPFEFGLPHTGLGNATLSTSGGNLVVSNIGSSGQDGVSMDLGETEGMRIDIDTLNLDTSGDTLTLNPIHAAGNYVTGLQNNAGTYEITADYAQLGATNVRVEVLKNGIVQSSAVVAGGGVVGTLTTAPVNPLMGASLGILSGNGAGDPFNGIDVSVTGATTQLAFETDLSFTPTGGSAVVGDAFRMSADNPATTMPAVSSVDVTAANLGSLTVNDEAIQLFDGLDNRGLGQAAIRGSSGSLIVSNIGSSGLDGVSIDLGGSTGPIDPNQFDVALSLDPILGALTIGAEIDLSLIDKSTGSSLIDKSTGSALQLVSNIGSSGEDGVRITSDFSDLGAVSAIIEIQQEGGPLMTFTGVSAATPLDLAISSSSPGLFIDNIGSSGEDGIAMSFDQMVEFSIPVLGGFSTTGSGGPFPLDPSKTTMVRIHAEGATDPFEEITDVELRFSDFHPVVINGLQLNPIPEPSSLLLVVLGVFVLFISRRRRKAPA